MFAISLGSRRSWLHLNLLISPRGVGVSPESRKRRELAISTTSSLAPEFIRPDSRHDHVMGWGSPDCLVNLYREGGSSVFEVSEEAPGLRSVCQIFDFSS